jgi:transposase
VEVVMGEEDARARVVTANRQQLELRPMDLDGLVAGDHPVRAMWAAVERLDLRAFYEPIRAREHQPGRPPTDPKVLVALWLYATADGIGSARELDRLCREHHAYQWLRGGVPINYHLLSDFRVGHERALDDLLTQLLAVLLEQRLITVQCVSQDGLRVRASAGTSSFGRRLKLTKCWAIARQQVAAVKAADAATVTAVQRAAQERAARERAARLQQALENLDAVVAQRAAQRGGRKPKGEARASSTDPTARTMKMADGGFRPAYNIQLATVPQSQVIVGVQVSPCASDQGQVPAMLAQVEARTGQRPQDYLVDGGYTDKASVEHCAARGVTLYGPEPQRPGMEPGQPRPGDSAAVREWRERMQTPAAKVMYKQRAPTSERPNADLRTHRTLDRMLVRGVAKVSCIALWNVLAYNVLRWAARSAMT